MKPTFGRMDGRGACPPKPGPWEESSKRSMKKSIEISSNIETLFGTRDENLHVLEDGLNITIDLRSNGH